MCDISLALRRLLLGLSLVLLAACGASDSARGPVVLAASSLQDALTEAGEAWAADGHAAPAFSFAATSALARQVEQGAPADLFLSADEAWMDRVEQRGRLRVGSRTEWLGNRLVLVAGKDGTVRSLADLGQGHLALADPKAVPAGKYAKAALQNLGVWDAVERRVVPAENVRAALALVERGEASLGLVYATDAAASDGVDVVRELPAASHPPIRYTAAILAASDHPDAEGFLAFLQSGEARETFAAHGFETVR